MTTFIRFVLNIISKFQQFTKSRDNQFSQSARLDYTQSKLDRNDYIQQSSCTHTHVYKDRECMFALQVEAYANESLLYRILYVSDVFHFHELAHLYDV